MLRIGKSCIYKDLKLQASSFISEAWNLKPQTSSLKLQTSGFRPEASNLKPQTSSSKLQTSGFRPEASNLKPQTSSLKTPQLQCCLGVSIMQSQGCAL